MEIQKGIVYRITNGKLNYYGSTFNLEQRKYHHKTTDYLQKILKDKKCRYDIMESGHFTKRELLDLEDNYIQNNFCINKRKPLQVFKSSKHKAMLKWGKSYVHCEACNKDITRWNICKHEKTLTHIKKTREQDLPADMLDGGKMSYMKALKIYNKRELASNPEHKFINPKKGTDEHLTVQQIFFEGDE